MPTLFKVRVNAHQASSDGHQINRPGKQPGATPLTPSETMPTHIGVWWQPKRRVRCHGDRVSDNRRSGIVRELTDR